MRIALLVTASFLISACQATLPKLPAPAGEIQAAATAVAAAENAGAGQYAAGELRVARDKLAKARQAVDEGQMELARRTALQAEADAGLSVARTQEAIATSGLQRIREESQ